MLPRFSIRLILILITTAAALSAVAARGFQGEAWAIGVLAAFGWAGLALVIHALLYLAAITLSGLEAGSPLPQEAPVEDFAQPSKQRQDTPMPLRGEEAPLDQA